MKEQELEQFMRLAIEEAKFALSEDEVPVGAVVVKDGAIISRAHNRCRALCDMSAHAEFLAMKEVARVLDAWRLTDCTVYVTLEPCIMCAGLMHQARVSRCVYGASDPKAGALGTLYSIHLDERLNHQFEVEAGVCESECAAMLKDFFAQRRARAKQLKRMGAECDAAAIPHEREGGPNENR